MPPARAAPLFSPRRGWGAPWGREDEALQAFYASLAQLKREAPALRRGDVTVLEAGNGRLLFLRRSETQTLAVCCNRSAQPWRLPSGGRLRLGGGLLECTEDFVVLDSCGYCVIEKQSRSAAGKC